MAETVHSRALAMPVLVVWQARQLTRKDLLKKHLQRQRQRSDRAAEAFDIMPLTFNLPKESLAFHEAFARCADEAKEAAEAADAAGGSASTPISIVEKTLRTGAGHAAYPTAAASSEGAAAAACVAAGGDASSASASSRGGAVTVVTSTSTVLLVFLPLVLLLFFLSRERFEREQCEARQRVRSRRRPCSSLLVMPSLSFDSSCIQ